MRWESAETRAASLRALGWPDGRLPGKKALLDHMLRRAEFEYTEHLYYDSVDSNSDASDFDGDGAPTATATTGSTR